ncbi:2-amino-4-hydroxy-6-hydroxymethyldihydropteridine diphosphokinase, partial [Salegentibacter sp.]|uniref:2-amino-4-hydroxy-6- hydroxymethyldihydropteridine diphosphokinase n=1 Tax=Salegentibacter sp. TaxID=1903072 RepID=UPI003566C540
MKSPKLVYIALGSNLGDRLGLLQQAVNRIYEEIGDVHQISKVYRTPAWGFEGDDFLNACIAVSTRFSAKKVLKKLLKIETEAGRLRSDSKDFHSRSLDLDILMMEEEIINSEDLILPHPHMQKRRFVLQPLA